MVEEEGKEVMEKAAKELRLMLVEPMKVILNNGGGGGVETKGVGGKGGKRR